MRFYLGTHEAGWLARAGVPLFVSRRRLALRRRWPRAAAPWALDSGGFSELNLYGEWRTTEAEYLADVRRCRDEVGLLDWAAPMDWMCEPAVLERTGLSVAEHQGRTVANFLRLRAAAPDLPFVPVLQGWTLRDYEQCADLYQRRGVDLAREPLVGVGTVCRRQASGEIEALLHGLKALRLRLHGFGVKRLGIARYADLLDSADSLAWSYRARMAGPQPGCTHKACANCLRFALRWRAEVVDRLTRTQLRLAL